jgi:hypothetical protein
MDGTRESASFKEEISSRPAGAWRIIVFCKIRRVNCYQRTSPLNAQSGIAIAIASLSEQAKIFFAKDPWIFGFHR